MRYIFLINYDPTVPYDGTNVMAEHQKLEGELRERGIFEGGAGLVPAEHTKSIRSRNGKVLTTDGPFPETKEVLGGFYIIECRNHEEAAEFAKRIPAEGRAWIDVRPIALWHPK